MSMVEHALRELVRDAVRQALEEQLPAVLSKVAPATVAAPASDYLTPDEAGALARVKPETVREWVRQGRLPGHHAGRSLRVRRDELEGFMRGRQEGPTEAELEKRALAIVRGGR